MLVTIIIAGGLTFASTSEAQQQPGQGRPGQDQVRPGQGQARPGQGQRPGRGQFQPGQGQRPQRPGGSSGRRNPFDGIGLSEEQQKKITAIQQEQTAALQKIRESTEAKIKKVLTKEQMEKYHEARSAQGSRGQGQGQGRRPGQGGRSNPYATLDLTEEQQEKFTAISAEQRAEMTKMFREMREAGGGFEGVREKMTALRAKYDQKIEAFLTDEQKKKYKEIQSQRNNRFRRPQPGSGRPRPDGKDRPRPKRSDA